MLKQKKAIDEIFSSSACNYESFRLGNKEIELKIKAKIADDKTYNEVWKASYGYGIVWSSSFARIWCSPELIIVTQISRTGSI